MRDSHWSHVHLTEDTLSFGEKTYNLKNKLNINMTVPSYYFGEEKQGKKLPTQGDKDSLRLSEVEMSLYADGADDDDDWDDLSDEYDE